MTLSEILIFALVLVWLWLFYSCAGYLMWRIRGERFHADIERNRREITRGRYN